MTAAMITSGIENAVAEAAADLVRTERVNGYWYVNVPLIYPDGTFVTVRIEQSRGGFRVSDAGFAYRIVEALDSPRSFRRTANKVAEAADVMVDERAIYVDAGADVLPRAICDVAEASWRIADHISQRVFDEDEELLADELTDRLVAFFGPKHVAPKKIVGSSTNEWPVSAVVTFPDHEAVFQAVAEHANSIYRASTAFRDIALLSKPPRLVAVVKDRASLGPRLTLLAPARVLNEADSEETYRKAAA